MPREPERTIMQRLGNPSNSAMSASAWDTTTSGTAFSALRRIYTWLLTLVGLLPASGTIATTADLLSAGTNDINATVKASVNAEADTALTDYDPPTKAELDAAVAPLALEATVAALNDLSAADVNAEADTALTDYDPPTKAELDAAVAPLALEATVAALNNLSAADVNAEADTALADYDPPTKAEMDSAIASAGILKRTVAGKAITSITTQNLFTISGGPITLIGFAGLITTGLEAATNVSNIQFTPTGGAAIDLCNTLELNGAAIRKFLTITGTKADAMALSTDEGIVVANLASPLVLSPGVISLTCAATTTGAITWYMVYEPMDPTATVA